MWQQLQHPLNPHLYLSQSFTESKSIHVLPPAPSYKVSARARLNRCVSNIEDETITANLIVATNIDLRFRNAIRSSAGLMARGKLQRQDQGVHLLVTHVQGLAAGRPLPGLMFPAMPAIFTKPACWPFHICGIIAPFHWLRRQIVMPDQPPKPPDLNTQMSAERTMLAWIRTGLALMGFGFVVAKFGLFLRRLAEIQNLHMPAPRGTSYSLWIGVCLVLVGVGVNVFSAIRNRNLMAVLQRGETPTKPQAPLAFYIALIMAAIGIAIAIYLAKLQP